MFLSRKTSSLLYTYNDIITYVYGLTVSVCYLCGKLYCSIVMFTVDPISHTSLLNTIQRHDCAVSAEARLVLWCWDGRARLDVLVYG